MSASTEPTGYRTTTEEVLSRNDIDIKGKTFLITGATSGLGEETARALAKHGAKIIFSARDLSAAEKVATKIREETPGAEITYYKLDLSSLASVKAFAEEVKASGVQLNGLILNAGIMASPYGKTVDGFETQFGTNHVAQFLLTRLLLDNLLNNAPARVIVVSSSAHDLGDVHMEDYNFEKRPYEKWASYGQSKTANILFAYQLNKLYASRGVEAFSLHPGGILTPLYRHMEDAELIKFGIKDAKGNSGGFVKTVSQGAATQVWAATAPELTGKGGSYLENVSVSKPQTEQANDPAAAEKLWVITEELIKTHL